MFDFYGKLKFLEKPVEELEAKPVEKGKILFYGHSLFTRWSNAYGNRELSEDLRLKDGSLGCVNHGFGGSTSEDLLYYYDRLVRPYAPGRWCLPPWQMTPSTPLTWTRPFVICSASAIGRTQISPAFPST